jgi:hypothetical protein
MKTKMGQKQVICIIVAVVAAVLLANEVGIVNLFAVWPGEPGGPSEPAPRSTNMMLVIVYGAVLVGSVYFGFIQKKKRRKR